MMTCFLTTFSAFSELSRNLANRSDFIARAAYPALPPNDKFAEEATEIHWKFVSDGKIIIEPKDDIKKRIGRSPDDFDALANTFYPSNAIESVSDADIEDDFS